MENDTNLNKGRYIGEPEITRGENSFSRPERFLIGQLGSFGDCLYATAVARQIKYDHPGCHVTWAVGSLFRSILEGNPYVDEIWEFPLYKREDLIDRWDEFEKEAKRRKNMGDFDEIYLTQVIPGNLKNFDGTLRSSIFRAYDNSITVPIAPVICLSHQEVENVRIFADTYNINFYQKVILFECSPKSGQSSVTSEFAIDVSKQLIERFLDLCIVISTNEEINSPDPRIIDGSVLSFRENAEITKYCSLLIGCSSGISWLCTSEWAKPLPMIQLLKKETGMYASFIHDHEYFGLGTDLIIEMNECSNSQLFHCVEDIFNNNFKIARKKYYKRVQLSFTFYARIISGGLLRKGKFKEAIISLRHTIRRYGLRPQIFSGFCILLIRFLVSFLRKLDNRPYIS